MFAQLIAEKVGAPSNRRGARGFRQHLPRGFEGLSDGPLGIPGVYAYTLGNGHVVYLPEDWNSMGAVQKLLWIQSSDLSPQDSIQLETEAGIQDPAIRPDPFLNLPPAGALAARPSGDYVRSGDVVRVSIPLQSGIYIAQGDVLSAIATGIRAYQLNYVNGVTPGLLGGSLTVDVQAAVDFSHLADIAATVQGIAQGVGGIVTAGPASAVFVSKVEATGGNVQITAPPAFTGAGQDIRNLENFAGNPLDRLSKALGISGTNLLLIGGGGVLLLIVLAKK